MNKNIGIIIIHGFGGSIQEIEPLNNYMLDSGFKTYCPNLKGHTGNKKDLAMSNYKEWINSAEEGLLKLQEYCDDIIFVGFSMGGLIATNLAVKSNPLALITLSSPIYYWDLKRVALNIVSDFKAKSFKYLRFYIKSTTKTPFRAMLNFRILLYKTKVLFKNIKCPMFIAQGLLDDTVHYKSAEYIYSNILSEKKYIKHYKNSNHIICHSEDKEQLFEDIYSFIKSL